MEKEILMARLIERRQHVARCATGYLHEDAEENWADIHIPTCTCVSNFTGASLNQSQEAILPLSACAQDLWTGVFGCAPILLGLARPLDLNRAIQIADCCGHSRLRPDPVVVDVHL
jgi:hypothetical protein